MKRRDREVPTAPIAVVPEGTSCDASPALTVPSSGVDLEALERAVIAFALEHHGGNQVRSARFLGLSRSALIYRMRKYRLNAGRRRKTPQGPAGGSLAQRHER